MNDGYFTRERAEIIPHLPVGPLRLLDVGCGAGGVLATVKSVRDVAWAAGIEIVPDAAAIARDRFDLLLEGDVSAMLAQGDIALGSLDLILCLDVLEHLVDPWDAVRRLSPLLKPEGRLIVSVPNIRNWKFIWRLLTRGDFRYRDAGLLDRTHLRFFVKETAVALAESGGLRTVHAGSATRYGPWELRRMLIAVTGGRAETLIAKQFLIVAPSA
jgi:2-polyprenyl-3-methyl-5-hydroxy-6-metoxy-1,4-benzoquinol methylase